MAHSVDVLREGPVARVQMHRGGNNAIAEELLVELAAAMDELGSDPACRVVVLESAYERYFSVGADLTAMAAIDRASPQAEDLLAGQMEASARLFGCIERIPKPVVASIQGHALGGGCELALCCDFRVMVDDGHALIGQTEAALGLIPGAGGTQRLVRLIGRARALPMLLEASRLSAAQAAQVGLVDLSLAPEAYAAGLSGLVERLAASATFALGLIKEAVNEAGAEDLERGLKREARNFARAALSHDALVGVMSFMAKQPPEFEGR